MASSDFPGAPPPSGPGRIPSPLQALLVWLSAALAMVAASVGVAAVAAASAAARGANPKTALSDPSVSPLVNSATWIALGTLANELAVVVALFVWVRTLNPPRARVFPLARPSWVAVLGALMMVFGLSPLAEVAGELTHRLLGHEVTAARLVSNAAKGASPAGFALLLVCMAVAPAIVEETLFRGLLTAPFERQFAMGMLVPTVLFGLFHIEPTQVAGTIILGIGFAAARLCTGTLVTGMAAHLIYNAAVIVTVRYSSAVDDARHEIALWPVPLGLVLAAGGAAVLWRERRVLLDRRVGRRVRLPSWWF